MTFSEGEISGGREIPDGRATGPVPSWQVRALDRSFSDARARSVERLSQFVAAARSLAEETGSSSFTVQQVVARSGQSLKSFYRYFEGKDDVLLALLEEDIAVGALFLQDLVERVDDPVERVHAWLAGLFELMAAGEQGYVLLLVREHQRLSESRPEQLQVAVAPFVDMLERDLARASAGGSIRAGDPRRDALLIFQLVLGAIRDLVQGADDRSVDEVVAYLWGFCRRGLDA